MSTATPSDPPPSDIAQAIPEHEHGWINGIVRTFLHSNLSLILLVISVAVGAAALLITPREEDPQIVVPLADIYVSAPGLSSQEIERLVTTPLERILYQIDGVEYVYSMSRADSAIITVRFYVGQDRERSLVRLFKRLEEHKDLVPPGVAGWVMKPVEIDDVPIVTLTLRAKAQGSGGGGGVTDEYTLRRVAEELAARLAVVEDTSRVNVVGGLPRTITAYLDRETLAGRRLSILDVQRAVQASNLSLPAGDIQRNDAAITVRAGSVVRDGNDAGSLVVGVSDGRPVFLREVARVEDGPGERAAYVRHGWGPGRGFGAHEGGVGTVLGGTDTGAGAAVQSAALASVPAVTIAVAKKPGTNAVHVAGAVLKEAQRLQAEVVPADIDVVVTRNSGQTANEKVSELVEGLWVAILIVVALLTIGLGWRESLVVAVAVPVVFGLTLAVNLLAGYTINRVTLFALILSLGLLVDDPIVDVENIARHFALRAKATRSIVLEAVSEIRPPLIAATLAVIASFLPLFFITGMMGPYMRPMALNVPVTMVMSMVVAFTITPWLAFHLLKKRDWAKGHGGAGSKGGGGGGGGQADEFGAARASIQYRLLRPLLQPLLESRALGWTFLGVVGLLTIGAAMLAAFRQVPLKMLPFDNKAEVLLVLNADEGTTLEHTDGAVRDLEAALARIPEVTDFTSYVGLPSPVDFNGLVRHYYLRTFEHQAEVRVNLVGKKSRKDASHTLGLRERDALTAIAARSGARLKIVELPPGPPVIDTVAVEIYGRDDLAYGDLCAGAELLKRRLGVEPGVVEPDDTVEAARNEMVFVPDQEKAAINGVSVAEIAATVRGALTGADIGVAHAPGERQPLAIVARLPRADRSSPTDLSRVQVKGSGGQVVPLAELGRWERRAAEQTIYHKKLRRVAYVFAETAGRPPADVVVDVMADRAGTAAPQGAAIERSPGGWMARSSPRPLSHRAHLLPGGGIPWGLPDGLTAVWSGEGEWKITLDVFRDLGLAFGAALVMIYILLVAQTGSFAIPVVVMLAIPLTMVGIMPGFWLLGLISGRTVGGYSDPVFFTATAMIGMIALSGIVTRQSIILVDFIHVSLKRGRPFMDAVLEAGAVRLRPILLVVGAAMLSAIPIAIDPIFSGLAWALIFGLIASTMFTLLVIPLVYWMLYRNVPGHGVSGRGEA